MIVVLNEKIPVQFVETVKTYVEKYSWLVPAWVQELHISYGDSEGNVAAEEEESKRYRWAYIKLKPRFFIPSHSSEPEKSFIHELIHISTNPAQTLSENIIGDLTVHYDGTAKNFITNRMMEFYEAGTQDLAFAIYLFANQKPAPQTIEIVELQVVQT